VRILVANHSSYPRVAEGAKGQRLRRAYARRERGELDDAGYLEVARDYIAEIIREQEAAGCDVVTDGQVHWYDQISHPASHLDGVSIDGLIRFFDTNHLIRQPEVTGPIGGSFDLAADHTYAAGVATANVKAVLTGPYTMARHSILSSNGGLSSVAAAYADVVRSSIAGLVRVGATLVQIEEPSLLRFPEDAELVRNLLERATAERGDMRVSLVTYFGDATPIYGELVRMPVDILGFDLTYGPNVADLISSDPPSTAVALGVIDGRNTKLDDLDALVRILSPIVEALDMRGIAEVHIQPSCGLEYLPRDRALRKLERMREIRDAVTKVGA
jgi:5-methyltetrahydropteroyltriglutamate--homocysteine methyltransferase